MGVSCSTVYRALQRWEENCPVASKCGAGQKQFKMPKRCCTELVKAALLCVRVSGQKLGQKFGISHTMVQRILREENVHYLKRQKSPNYKGDQLKWARKACSVLRCHFFPSTGTTSIVMDDESYFFLKNDRDPANQGFYNKKDMFRGDVSHDVAIHALDKYPDKIMVWLCTSDCGVSQPYFMPWKDSIRGENYREHCINECLVPFLDKFHADGDYHFWPDLATSDYAKDTLAIFKEHSIAYIPCPANPQIAPNSAQLKTFGGSWSLKCMRVDGKQRLSISSSRE